MPGPAIIDVEQALELYAHGVSLQAIARGFETSRQAVHYKLARDPRYKPRSRAEAAHKAVDDDQVRSLWLDGGWTRRGLARHLGVSHYTVTRSLYRSGTIEAPDAEHPPGPES